MSIRTCPRCGRLTLDEDRQRNEWRCTVRSCNYWEPVREPIIRSAEHLRAENIQLRQQLADVETGNLTVAIQEAAELRDQRDALMLRLQASEQQRFRAEAQVRRVRSELDALEQVVVLGRGMFTRAGIHEAVTAIRAALDQEVGGDGPEQCGIRTVP